MRAKSALIVVALTVTMAGCASSKDPREGGFFGGLQGVLSGSYDERVQKRQDELAHQNEVSEELKEKSEILDREARNWESQLASEQQKLDELNGELAALESHVDRLKAKSAKQKAEIAALKQKIGEQKRKVKMQQAALKELERKGGGQVTFERRRVLESERKRLAEEHRLLMEYSQALSDAAK